MKEFFAWLASWGPLGLLGLSFVESLGIPNPGGTDFALVALVAVRPENAVLCAVLATVGSLVGSWVFFEITRKGGDTFFSGYKQRGRWARFRGWFERYGMVTVFIAALLPIPIMPFKVFAASAGALGVSRARFMWILAAARIPRYAGLAYLGVQLGGNSMGWIRAHLWHLGALAVVLMVVLFGLVWWSDRQRLAAAGEA